MHGITNECILVLQLPLLAIKQLINIAVLRHFRHDNTKKAFSFRGGEGALLNNMLSKTL